MGGLSGLQALNDIPITTYLIVMLGATGDSVSQFLAFLL